MDKRITYHQTLRSITALFSSNIAASALTAIGGFLVARFLGPDVTGAFRVYTIPLTYMIFLHCGTWDGLWRQIPYYTGKEMPDRVEEIASSAGAFSLFISAVVSIGFAGLAAYHYFTGNLQATFGWLSQAFFCWSIFYGGYLTATYRTLNQFVCLAKIQFSLSLQTLAMVFLLPLFGFYGLCLRNGLPGLFTTLLFHWNRPLKIPYRMNFGALKELIGIGIPFSIWGNLYTSIWLATESALILSKSGTKALGLFFVATIMKNAIDALPNSIWQVLTPQVVMDYAKTGTIGNSHGKLIRITTGLTFLMIIIALCGAILLDILVSVFIPKYNDGIQIMKLCLWFPVVQALFLPANTLFASGKSWMFGRGIILGFLTFIVTAHVLEPIYGGLTAVVTSSLLGRIVRTLEAYLELYLLTRQEKTMNDLT